MIHPAKNSARHAALRPTGLLLGLGLLGLLAGCFSNSGVTMRRPGTSRIDVTNDPAKLPAPTISQNLSPLDRVHIRIVTDGQPGQASSLLAPHDLVRYIFSYQPGQYHILPGDDLSIHFAADPKLDLSLVVRPDGRIGLSFLAAEFEAAGKEPSELAASIEDAARARLNKPGVSVSVTKANLGVAELSGEATLQSDGALFIPRLGRFAAAGLTPEALADQLTKAASADFKNPLVAQIIPLPAPRDTTVGLSRFDQILEIPSDGLLVLSELGAFDTNGKTVAGLQQAIQAALRERFPNQLSVLVALEASASRVIYIDGEVGHAGAYPLSPALTTLRAIALAGGVRETGDLKSVVVIHRESPESVTVYVTNLQAFIEKAAVHNDLALAPQDIVLVPRTTVAKADLWVDQYISRMLPFSRNVGYSYSQGTTSLTQTQP